MPGERKSVEPMAAIVAPTRVSAKHQSLLHLVGEAPWSDAAVLGKVRELVLPCIERQGPIEAWIVDFMPGKNCSFRHCAFSDFFNIG